MKIKIIPPNEAPRVRSLELEIRWRIYNKPYASAMALSKLIETLAERGILPLHDVQKILETDDIIEPFLE